MKNNQMRCYQCGQPGHYSKNCPEKRQNNMGRRSKLFVGLIDHSVNMLSHTGPHNPWILELDSSTSSAVTMDEDDRKPAARDDEETVEDIEFNDDVTGDPTDNLDDIKVFFTQRCQPMKTLERLTTTTTTMDPSHSLGAMRTSPRQMRSTWHTSLSTGSSTHFVTSVTTAISS
jgi:Zinc knuckle